MSVRIRCALTRREAAAKPCRPALSRACKYLLALPRPPAGLLCQLRAAAADFAGDPTAKLAGILEAYLPPVAQRLSNALPRARTKSPADPQRIRGSGDSRVAQLFPSRSSALK